MSSDWQEDGYIVVQPSLAYYAVSNASSAIPVKIFTWGIGLLSLALSVYDWFILGLLLSTPFATLIGLADNVFRPILSVPALLVIFLAISVSGQNSERSERFRI